MSNIKSSYDIEGVAYTSNNSGGGWWVTDRQWELLEEAGWVVDWVKDQTDPFMAEAKRDGRWLGALATRAVLPGEKSERVAKVRWEEVTGMDADAEGCHCCGQPHSFWYQDGK